MLTLSSFPWDNYLEYFDFEVNYMDSNGDTHTAQLEQCLYEWSYIFCLPDEAKFMKPKEVQVRTALTSQQIVASSFSI